MTATTPDHDRTEVDHARVSLFAEPDHYDEGWTNYIVVPTADDVTVFDLGDLVTDRIESNGRVTFPEERPEEGDRMELGTVYWDDRGIPTRLVRADDAVYFTADGGFDRIEPRD